MIYNGVRRLLFRSVHVWRKRSKLIRHDLWGVFDRNQRFGTFHFHRNVIATSSKDGSRLPCWKCKNRDHLLVRPYIRSKRWNQPRRSNLAWPVERRALWSIKSGRSVPLWILTDADTSKVGRCFYCSLLGREVKG